MLQVSQRFHFCDLHKHELLIIHQVGKYLVNSYRRMQVGGLFRFCQHFFIYE
jgi:hypothetical protein